MTGEHDGRGQGGMPHAQQEHIEPLDGLRGLAAMLVVFSHLSGGEGSQFVPKQIGNYGVFLFFVLSGFLMGHLYLSKPFNKGRAYTYFAARISRIVPIYYLVVIAGFFYGRYVDPTFPYEMDSIDLLRHLAFVGNVAVFWSIGPEFQFYFAFPLLWWLFSQPSERVTLASVLTLAMVLVIFLFRDEWPGVLMLSKLHIFVAGILLGVIRPHLLARMSPSSILIAQVLATCVLVMLLLPENVAGTTLYPLSSGDVKHNSYYGDFGKLFILTFVVGAFSLPARLGHVLFGNRLLKLIGKYSFSIYLLHAPVLYGLSRVAIFSGLPDIMTVAIAVVAVVLISGVSFNLIEDPTRIAVRNMLLRLFGSGLGRRY